MKKLFILLSLCTLANGMEKNNKLSDLDNNQEVIQALDLSHSELDQFDNITMFDQLEKLDLRYNSLRQLPTEIGNLSNLRLLFVDNNRIKQLPRQINALRDLVGLRLDNNQLTQLPNMQSLHKLEFVSLKGNKITSINDGTEAIVFPPQIMCVNLQENEIVDLPTSLSKLTKLITLNLAHNKLTRLPEELGNCTSLQELNISHNKLTNLPSVIAQLTNVKSVDFNDNAEQLIKTCAQNMSLAIWLATPVIKELFLQAIKFKQACDYCSPLEHLPEEMIEKIIISLAQGSNFIEDCNAILGLSQTNKWFHAIVKHPKLRTKLKNKLYEFSPLLTDWYLEASNESTRVNALSNRSIHDMYILQQDVRSIFCDNNERSKTISKYLLRKIKQKNQSFQKELECDTDKRYAIVHRYPDGSALIMEQNRYHHALQLKNVLNVGYYVSNNQMYNVVDKNGITISAPEENPKNLPYKETDQKNNDFAWTRVSPLYFPSNKVLYEYEYDMSNDQHKLQRIYIAVQKDHKIIVACLAQWNKAYILFKINTDGTLDREFGKNGIIPTDITYDNNQRVEKLHKLTESEREQFIEEEQINSFVTIDPKNGDIIFKFEDTMKKYDSDGNEIA